MRYELGNVDFNLSIVHVVKSLTESGPLKNDSRDEEIQRHCAVTVTLQKRHQESKPDKHHHVNILKHCSERTKVEELLGQTEDKCILIEIY